MHQIGRQLGQAPVVVILLGLPVQSRPVHEGSASPRVPGLLCVYDQVMGGRGSGGARPQSGPAPDPYALNRARDGKEWTHLNSAGRLEPAPEWPDDVPDPSPAELLRWRTLWATPQALVWESDGIYDQVALYVRVYVEAMQPGALGGTRTLAKQLQNELLLTVPSMLSARYVIKGTKESDAIEAAMAGSAPATVSQMPGTQSAKNRFTVVPVGPDPSAVAPSEDDDDDDDDVEDDDPDEPIPF